MKSTALRALRAAGMLRAADTVSYWTRRMRAAPSNRRFRQRYPDFPVPPPDLVFDALNHMTWEIYLEQGRRHAAVLAELILQHCPSGPIEVLEWGSGPGRLIRHMPKLLARREPSMTGSDFNERSVAWCRDNLPGIEFVTNDLLPPLPLPDNRFDAIYNFSVLTHLSEEAQLAWAQELKRTLKPGGLLICTTHGERYHGLLASRDERARFTDGNVVVQGRYVEGKKWYLAIHPEEWVRDALLSSYEDVRLMPGPPGLDLLQDIWIARKPPNGSR